MPYFSMAMRSRPMPQAKPWYSSGSSPPERSTFGWTMPQPRISIQSVPSPNLTIGPERSHWISTSKDGSVKGKKDGRKRIVTDGTSKKALQNSSKTQRMLPTFDFLSMTRPST
ncbi:hypothetical protein D3C71_1471030 [compost metagenome]